MTTTGFSPSLDAVYFCPKCQSPRVEFSSLAGGAASCSGCGWSGTRDDLLFRPIQHLCGMPETMVQQLFNDYRGFFARNGKEFGELLIKWGFVDIKKPEAAKVVTRYLIAFVKAGVQSMLELRVLLQAEKEGGKGVSN